MQSGNGDILKQMLESFPMMQAIPSLKAATIDLEQGRMTHDQVILSATHPHNYCCLYYYYLHDWGDDDDDKALFPSPAPIISLS